MKFAFLLIFVFTCTDILGQRVFDVKNFAFPTALDTMSFKNNEDPKTTFNSKVKLIWKDQVYDDNQKLDRQALSNPFFYKGIIFLSNSPEYAYDALTGKRIPFGSDEANIRFKDFGQDTLICLNYLSDLRSVVVNIKSGKKIAELVKQPYSKAPFFLQDKIWLYTTRVDKIRMLKAKDLNSGADIWSMPFEKFAFSKTFVSKDYLFTADPKFLYAIEIRSGKVLWKFTLKVNYIEHKDNVLYVDSSEGLYAVDISKIEAPKISWGLASKEGILDVNCREKVVYIQKYKNLLAFDGEKKSVTWKANFYFNFYPSDQLAIIGDYVITVNTEDTKYILLYNRKTGKLIASDIKSSAGFNLAKEGAKNVFFATSNQGKWVYAFEIKEN